MTKVYTRTGDDGTTHCFKSGRVAKDDVLIESIGSVDELNSLVGLLVSHLEESSDHQQESKQLKSIQNRLFDVGGALATYSAEKQFSELLSRIDESPLEDWIDRMDTELTEIRQFILPGGTMVASQTHVCRSVCRRAERNVVGVLASFETESESIRNGILKLIRYLNRLSDYLFVLSRYFNKLAGCDEVFWTSED